MFGYLKMMFAVVLIAGISGAGMYVMKLRSDNAILKANQIKLEEAVSSQKELIAKQEADFKEILAANQKMNDLNATNLEGAINMVKGSAVSMGMEVVNS